VMKSFSDWVERGYNDMTLKSDPLSNLCSWRFWAQGPKKEILICGLLRNSSDHIGRPYPLLILGTGHLKGFEKNWDLLPFTCEKTWSQTEKISTTMFENLKNFEEEVQTIKLLSGQWEEFNNERKDQWNFLPPDCIKELEEYILNEKENDVIVGCLNQEWCSDQFSLINLWHFFLKKYTMTIPHVVFMGGTPDVAYMVIFKRPLMPDDFKRLWHIHQINSSKDEEISENGSFATR